MRFDWSRASHAEGHILLGHPVISPSDVKSAYKSAFSFCCQVVTSEGNILSGHPVVFPSHVILPSDVKSAYKSTYALLVKL